MSAPPVPTMLQRVTEQPLVLDALIAETESPDAGALMVFAGTVRAQNDGRQVVAIEYSAYAPLAEKALAEIEQNSLRDFAITRCCIRHRIGALKIGDTSVLIVVRAVHRTDAFAAGRYAIDTVKRTVPIWKCETYSDGSQTYLQGETLLPHWQAQKKSP